MTMKNQAGIGVYKNYGARATGGSVGVEESENSVTRLSIQLTGEMINSGFVPPVVVPKGAKFKNATLRVDEAFVLTGTTPTIRVGALGAIATNGFVISEAQAEAVGTTDITPGAGTWALASTTGTTTATKVGIDLGGTTPVVTNAGKAVLVLEYFYKAKA